MGNYFDTLAKDLADDKLPRDYKSFEKVKCPLTVGTTVRWYYKDEAKFRKREGLNPRETTSYYGIIIPKPDSASAREIDPMDCVVVVLGYPCEKCGPEVDYVTLSRMVDDDELVEVFAKK